MSPKVYLFVTPFFPAPGDWRFGYAYNFVRTLEKIIDERVLVFKEGNGSDYEIRGVRVYTFKTWHLPSNVAPFLFKCHNQSNFVKKVKSVGERDHWCLDDVCVCHGNTANYGIYPLAIKKLNSTCQSLLQHHDLQSFGLNLGRLRHCWLYNMILFPILRRMHEKIDTHVFISENCRRSFLKAPDTSWTEYTDYKKQMRGLPYRSVRIKDSIILHNGVDKTIFNTGSIEGKELRSDKTFIIGCVGNFQELKDQVSLLKAVSLLNKKNDNIRIKVIFIGSGETLETCKQLAQELGIKVEFKKEIQHSQLVSFYRSLDLFVLPTWFEGFGCVLTEAHSCGTPFITCEGQGVDDIIPDKEKSLWLCKQRDPEDLASKIGHLIQMKKSLTNEEWAHLQRLNEDQDINSIVGEFVDKLKDRIVV